MYDRVAYTIRRSVAGLLFVYLFAAASALAAPRQLALVSGAVETAPAWRVVDADDATLRLAFTLDALQVEDVEANGETWQSLTIEGGALLGAEGAPGLPTAGRLVAVPDGAEVSARVVDHQTTVLPDLRLLPVQSPGEADFAYDRGVYATPGWLTPTNSTPTVAKAAGVAEAPIVLLGAPAVMAGQTVVPVTVCPVAYDPLARTARVAGNVEIELTFTGGATKTATRPVPPSFDTWMRDNVAGYDVRPRPAAALPGTYCIVRRGDGAIANRLAPLIEWRRRQGYHVEVLDVDVIGNQRYMIKNALQALYNDDSIPPLEFVTFVGDVDGPYFVMTASEGFSGYGGQGDHYYARLDSGDQLGDVHVGRLSFQTLLELQIMVAKIVNYEQSPPMGDTSWYRRACLVGDPEYSGATVVYVNQWLKGQLESLGWAQVDTVWSGNFPFEMMAAIGSGLNVFGYRGYYDMSGLTVSYINNLQNGGRLPVALFPTCETGTLSDYVCRSEAFLRAPNGGAVAAVGTATSGTHTRYNNCYYQGAWNGLLHNDDHRVGVAHTLGKTELYVNYQTGEPEAVAIWSVWNNLIGDPATDIWLGVPRSLAVDHPPVLPPGAVAVPVKVTSGVAPAAGLVVCAYRVGAPAVSGLTDADGEILLSVPPLASGPVSITVYGHGYLPYQGEISVDVAKIHCEPEEIVVDGDGVLNPGETVELSVAVRNLGVVDAPGVTATLGDGAPHGVVVAGELDFGDVPAGEVRWATASAVVTAAADAPDGATIAWPMTVSCDGGELNTLVETRVHGADFAVAGYAWSGGGATLDPGESGGLVLSLDNAGSVDATGVSALLTSRSPWVTVVDGVADFGDVAAGAMVDNAASPFSLEVFSLCYGGHLAALTLELTCADGRRQTREYVLPIGTAAGDAPCGPDDYGYYAYDDTDRDSYKAPVFDWIAIDPDHVGPGVDVGLGDFGWEQDDTRTIGLPFTFRYYGRDYDRVSICSNGWLAMGEMNLVPYTNGAIPSAGAPAAMIAPFWDDLQQYGGRRVYTWHDEVGHRFVVQWYGLFNAFSHAEQNFEVVLYDPAWHETPTGDGRILFQYERVGNTDTRDGYATVGIQNPERTGGLMYTFWNAYAAGAAPLAGGRAILFEPLGEVLLPSAACTPGAISVYTSAGSTVEEHLHIANDGEAGSRLQFSVAKIDPATVPAARAAAKNVTNTYVEFDADEYDAGATTTISMTVDCLSSDWEPIAAVELTLPPMVTLVTATDMWVPSSPLAWNGVAGSGVTTRWSGGTVGYDQTGRVDLVLAFDPALTGEANFVWTAFGLGWNLPPHQVSGALVLTQGEPRIEVIAPAAGDLAVIGDELDIAFAAANGPAVATIELQRVEDGPWEPLAEAVLLAAGTWTWTVAGEPGPWAVIRVSDMVDLAVSGESGPFAVGRNLDWLGLSSASGTVDAGASFDLILTLDATALSNGLYEANLVIDNSGGPPTTVPIRLVVAEGTGLEDAPPTRVALLGAHPNPFNPRTSIAFALPAEMEVELGVYTALGARVRTLLSGRHPAGRHRVLWDGRDAGGREVASGVYVYRLKTREGTLSGKVALLR